MPYGYELIIDCYGCDPDRFTRAALLEFFGAICGRLGLTPEELHWWDYADPKEKAAAPPHLKGTSAVQFIKTSSLTVHALDDLGIVFINLFTCGEFKDSTDRIADWCKQFFDGDECECQVIERGGAH